MTTPKTQQDVKTDINETIQRLKQEELALVGKKKNQPVIIYRHKRWHLIMLGFLVDEKMHSKRGISNINFISSARARKYLIEELSYCKLVSITEVLPHFEEELAAKVLPTAEDYRLLLQNEWVQLAGGFTSDTLHENSIKNNDIETLVAHLAEIMQKGPMGPFLHFEKYFTALH
jgi:hypothetical protein